MRVANTLPKFGKRYAFVVDGECEAWYIQMLKRNEKSVQITLEPIIPQKKKLADQYKSVITHSKDYDKVFWIIDFDVIISETRLAKKGTKSALTEFKEYYEKIEKINSKIVDANQKIVVIINNPALEFWFLLHFEMTSKYFSTCDEAIKQLKKHLPDYEKTKHYFTKQDNDIYLKLRSSLNKANTNASKLSPFDIEETFRGVSEMNKIFEQELIKHIF